jgi:predicted dehydrogenase
MGRGNGHSKRIALQPLSNPPEGRAVLNFQGGPYVHAGVHEVDFVCGICGKVVASVPDKIQFMSDSGPAIFVCYACGAYNEAP